MFYDTVLDVILLILDCTYIYILKFFSFKKDFLQSSPIIFINGRPF